MKYNEYKINATVWLYPDMAGWYFVTIPEDVSEDIKHQFGDMKRGWGSIPVKAITGKTTWETSIFPDKKTKCLSSTSQSGGAKKGKYYCRPKKLPLYWK